MATRTISRDDLLSQYAKLEARVNCLETGKWAAVKDESQISLFDLLTKIEELNKRIDTLEAMKSRPGAGNPYGWFPGYFPPAPSLQGPSSGVVDIVTDANPVKTTCWDFSPTTIGTTLKDHLHTGSVVLHQGANAVEWSYDCATGLVAISSTEASAQDIQEYMAKAIAQAKDEGDSGL